MFKGLKYNISVLMLGSCLLMTACGGESAEQQSSVEESSSMSFEDVLQEGNIEKINEYMGIHAEDLETSEAEETPENVILVAAKARDYSDIYDIILGFNQSQSEYKAEVKKYEDRDDMLLDLVRGKGCDVLVLPSTYLTMLSDKGGLEDLAPYIEKSEAVDKEDLFEIVWDIGMANGKLAGIISDFSVQAILVEKGYTENGGWTLEKYLALMDLYPDVPLNQYSNAEDFWNWHMNELGELPESFVDWETRTCSFDSDEFIQTIQDLKSYLDKGLKVDYDSNGMYLGAERMYRRQIQTLRVNFEYQVWFSEYKQIRDTFLDSYELAGFPNLEGEVKYPVQLSDPLCFCINGASGKKEAAWQLLEYMLSEECQQAILDARKFGFSVRRDVLEERLQEEVEADPEEVYYMYTNRYTGEKVIERGEFTEEDKELILYILNHAAPLPMLYKDKGFTDIYGEELDAFLAGDKTAEETAKNLQNRMSLYLME